MRLSSAVAVLLVIATAAPAAAQDVDGVQFFPVVARISGVGDSQ